MVMFNRACYLGDWLSRIAIRGRSLPLTPIFSDYFKEKSGIFWETVGPKPKIFREFLGFWAGPFELKFREFLGFWSFRILSGNFREFLAFWCAGGF